MNILVIAAHPDDEALGCGGTIARLAGEGHSVHISILGEGITSRYEQPEEADTSALQMLHNDSYEVSKILGASDVQLHGLPDNRFDTVPLLSVVKIIEQRVQELSPELVFTQHGGDLNVDHVVTYRATLTATRPMQGRSTRALYAYEVASSSEWAFQRFSPVFHPSVFYDIHATLDTKIQAMQHYESEARPYPHPRSPEALRANAQRWGSVVGYAAAEAFEVVWEIR